MYTTSAEYSTLSDSTQFTCPIGSIMCKSFTCSRISDSYNIIDTSLFYSLRNRIAVNLIISYVTNYQIPPFTHAWIIDAEYII